MVEANVRSRVVISVDKEKEIAGIDSSGKLINVGSFFKTIDLQTLSNDAPPWEEAVDFLSPNLVK